MFNIGDFVRVKNANVYGKIVRVSNQKEGISYTILCDLGRLTINENMLEIAKEVKRKAKNTNGVSFTLNNNDDENLDEIMLRHQFKDEAIENLDRFIDKAVSNRKKKVRIIHGRHGGVLRNAVHEYLEKHPNVEKFELAEYYEGSIGVTIAYLK